MSKTYVYEPLPEGAKPVAWWWAILQLILMFIIAIIGAAILAVIASISAVSIAVLQGSFDPSQGGEPPAYVMGVSVVAAMFGLFITLILCALAKIKMEKRSFSSAGLNGFLYGGRFWSGFLGGLVIAAVLLIPSAIAGMVLTMPEPDGEFIIARVMTPEFGIAVIVIFLFVMIQAPAEEILMRGWMFSALTWRHSLITGIIVSSILFSLLHIDRAIAGPMWALYTLLAVGSIGVLFAGVSYAARSVLPAAGMHTGYNFLLIVLSVAYIVGTSDGTDVFTALGEAFDLSNLEAFEFTPNMIVDMLARGLIPIAIAVWLFRRKRALPGE